MITGLLPNLLKSVLNNWYLARLSISAVETSEAHLKRTVEMQQRALVRSSRAEVTMRKARAG